MAPAASQREAKAQAGAAKTRARGVFVYRGEFRNNVEKLMYAFGDEQKPDPDSLALMEDMVLTFLVDLCHRARPQPHKIPVMSNQNTINTIAAGILLQDGGAESSGVDAVTDVNTRKGATNSRSKEKKEAVVVAAKQFMPPRLAAHPYVARPRMTVEDLKFACRKEAKMSTRIEELLYLDKVITDAQKAFNNPEEDVADKAA
ncbi:hypothetical protein CBS101457_003697 [Exobasidium rhododendri]|nr:hypothetical protein CBS101457_003697 [Exobasidium rhododendri]